eukprot:m.15873 g.15873  ORF g.15873 m.15873 type:complete len:286 (+) comp7913_c0_seq1:1860-2717(+)
MTIRIIWYMKETQHVCEASHSLIPICFIVFCFTQKGEKRPIRWLSPESLLKRSISLEGDVYSFGVTCWEILRLGAVPHCEMSIEEYVTHQRNNTLPSHVFPPDTLKHVADALTEAVNHSPALRPSFSSLRETLATCVDEKRITKQIEVIMSSFDGIDWVNGIGEVVFSGFLIKKGGGKSALGRQSWKKRWFVLRDNGFLSYQKSSSPSSKPLRLINLRVATEVKDAPPFSTEFKNLHCFTLVTEERTFQFVSLAKTQKDAWMNYLQFALSAYKEEAKSFLSSSVQ